MYTIAEIIVPETIEEAYEVLTKRKTNTILGGGAYLRMGQKRIGTAIELSKLNLDYIKDNGNEFEIGAMATFRDIEVNEELNSYFNAVIKKSVENIIGVQFRNIVTVGATVFSKYGFSDFITALLCLDTDVELVKGGRMSLKDFLVRPYEKDFLIRMYIKKKNMSCSFIDFRNSKGDYSVLNIAVSLDENNTWKIVVGARPRGATIAEEAGEFLSSVEASEENIDKAAEMVSSELSFGTNMRGSKEYRQALSKALTKKAIMEVLSWK